MPVEKATQTLFFIFLSVFFLSLCFHADIFTIESRFHLGQWHLVFKANKHETICFENMWVDDKVIRISEKCQRECQESQFSCVSYMKMEFGALCTDSLHTVQKFLCFCWALLSSFTVSPLDDFERSILLCTECTS